MERRILFCLSLALLSGVYYWDCAHPNRWVCLITVVLQILVVAFGVYERWVSWHWFLIPVAFVLGMGLCHAGYQKALNLKDLKGEAVELQGHAYGLERTGNIMVLKEAKIRHKGKEIVLPLAIKLLLDKNQTVPEGVNGKWITVRTTWKPLEGLKNPNGFDYQNFLVQDGYQGAIHISKWQIVESKECKTTIESAVYAFRSWYIDGLKHVLTGERSAIAYAMFVGDSSLISQEFIESFRISGLGHLVAVSGLHFALIYQWLRWVLSKLKMKTRLATVVIVVILTVLGFINGWSSSALRAWGMIALISVARLTYRRYDGLIALAIVAMVSVFFNPLSVLQIGFQLSYGVALSIIVIAPLIKDKLTIVKGDIREYLSTAIAVQVPLLGIGLVGFNVWNPLSIIINIPAIVLAEWMMPLLTLFPLVFLLGGVVSKGYGFFLNVLIGLMEQCAGFMPGIAETCYYPTPGIATLVGFCGAIILIVRGVTEVKGDSAGRVVFNKGLALMVLISVVCSFFVSNETSVTFFDVGQGDSTLIKMKDQYILIDAGSKSVHLDKLLLRNGIGELKMLVITHGHEDHIGGAVDVIKHLKVEKVIIGAIEKDNPLFEELIKVATENSVPVIQRLKGDVLYSDRNHSIKVLYPFDGKSKENLNENSMVIKFKSDDCSCLITGDIEKSSEAEMLAEKEAIHADIVKVPHHGSATSSTSQWIDAVAPEIAVISVGPNLYGHPSRAIIEAYVKKEAQVIRTDHSGAVRIYIEKDKMQYKTWR